MTAISNIAANIKFQVTDVMSRFRRDCEGVAALEFALIAPIMIMLFVGTLEVSAAVSVNRKVSRISSVVGDLVTQSDKLTADEVDKIMAVSSDIMRPYTNAVKIRITGVIIASGNATVDWSCNQAWTSLAKGSPYTVPSRIRTNGTFLVAAVVQSVYQPMVGWARYSGTSGISFDSTAVTMNEEIFLRPRIGTAVDTGLLEAGPNNLIAIRLGFSLI